MSGDPIRNSPCEKNRVGREVKMYNFLLTKNNDRPT